MEHRGSAPSAGSSFGGLSEEELDTHLAITKYDNFVLTGAVAPSYDLKIKPRTGFRFDYYRECIFSTPIIMISASREILFALFMELIDLVDKKQADVVLETSHVQRLGGHHVDLLTEDMDVPVLKSILWDFEKLLVEDGCAGIAITSSAKQMELQLDEHKMLIFYNWPPVRGALSAILKEYGVQEDPYMRFITEAEHVHRSSERFEEEFKQLALRLGAEEEI